METTRRGFLGSVIGMFAAAQIPYIAAKISSPLIESNGH